MRLMAVLFGVVAIMVIAEGCGSSGGDGTSESLSKAEFLKQGNEICAKALEQTREEYAAIVKKNEGKKSSGASKASEEGELADVMLNYYRTKTDELSKLTPPEADKEQITMMLGRLEKVIEEAEEDPAVLFEGSKVVNQERRIAEVYGLDQCMAV